MHNSWGDAPLFRGDLPHVWKGRPVSGSVRREVVIMDVIHDVLSRHYGRLKHGAKILAGHAKSPPRTAENWLDKSCTPNAQNLFNIMQHCDELRETFYRLAKEDT